MIEGSNANKENAESTMGWEIVGTLLQLLCEALVPMDQYTGPAYFC